jgi:hypothetical protein
MSAIKELRNKENSSLISQCDYDRTRKAILELDTRLKRMEGPVEDEAIEKSVEEIIYAAETLGPVNFKLKVREILKAMKGRYEHDKRRR